MVHLIILLGVLYCFDQSHRVIYEILMQHIQTQNGDMTNVIYTVDVWNSYPVIIGIPDLVTDNN